MLLHRSPRGIISTDDAATVAVRTRPAMRIAKRVTHAAFHAGALDAMIVAAFDVVTLAEASARSLNDWRGLHIAPPIEGAHPERTEVRRTWTSEVGDPRMVWILGRNVHASNGNVDYEAAFDVHLASGFPAALRDDIGPEVVEDVRASVAALNPLPCFCHTGFEGPRQHGTLETLVTKESAHEGLDVRASVERCTICNAAWTSEWRGDSRRGFYTTRAFAPRVDLDEDEVDRIVAGIRGGAEVVVGCSRCHTTYRGRDGQLFAEDFDEGHTDEKPCTESTLRYVILGERETFLPVLREPLLRQFRAALASGATNMHDARDALPMLLAYGDCFHHTDILETVIAWPEEKPTAEAFATMTATTTGVDLYHSIMSAIGYGTKTAEGAAFGLRFFSAVAELRGSEAMPRFRRYRASFRAMAGDVRGALEDLAWEKARQASDDSDATYLDREIATLEKRLAEEPATAAATADTAPKRSLTLMLVSPRDPDALDEETYAERRANGGGWTKMVLHYPGEPDVLVRLALDLDMGVYGEERGWDPDESCVVETSCIFHAGLKESAALLAAHAANPEVLAARLVAHAESAEDPARVARAIVEATTERACGPAEEAATYVRLFLSETPHALRLLMGIAWELRTPAPCECAKWEGTTLGNIRVFPKDLFETLSRETEASGAQAGRLRCVRCSSAFRFVSVPTHTDVIR